MSTCECGKPACCRGMCQAHYYRVLRRERRVRRGLPPVAPRPQSAESMRADAEDARHGTTGGYTNCACRCERCRGAQADALRKYRAGVVS